MAKGLSFELVPGWEQLPAGYAHGDVDGIAVDEKDRVFVLTRRDQRVIIYNRDGSFVASWGEKIFTPRTHGISIGPDGMVYCADDGDHTVRKFTSNGDLLMTIGVPGVASDTGYDIKQGVASIAKAGPPFNRPTKADVAKNGDIFVSDGYGNCRVHRFNAKGELIQSWGEPGGGPGQFNLVHALTVMPDGRIAVCDRENDRIQFFTPDGKYLSEWTHLQRPTELHVGRDGNIYVSELWWRKGQKSFRHGIMDPERPGRVSVVDKDGKILLQFGHTGDRAVPGNFVATHCICTDSKGDMYVGEVTWTFGVSLGLVPDGTHVLQKFARKG